MNMFPHTNLTLARLASETLEPLKHLIFEIFIHCCLYFYDVFSQRFPNYPIYSPLTTCGELDSTNNRLIICALVCSLIPEQTLYLVAS